MLNKKIKKTQPVNNEFKDFIDIFNKNLNINMKSDISNNINNEIDNVIINKINKLKITKKYIYIYIYSYNVCNPQKYEEDKIYINNTGILTDNNNNINYTTKLIINRKYINCINKIKIGKYYYKLVYLKKRYNFTDLDMNWNDNMYFYNLYNHKNKNFIECILKDNNIKKKISIINNEIVHSKLNILQIYNNMNKNFNKIFL